MRKALAVLVTGVALAGCGSEASSKGGYASIGQAAGTKFGPPQGFVRVQMRNIAFVPTNVHLRRGGSIHWVNRDQVTHTVTKGDELYPDFTSGEVQPGHTYRRTFDKPGEYAYQCTIHANMRGRIKVD